MTSPATTNGVVGPRSAAEPSVIRILGRIRTYHLEEFRLMAPARVLYTGTRYDLDLSQADPVNPPVKVTRAGAVRELLRRHYDVVQINEPSMVDRWGFLLALVVAARVRSLVDRRPTAIVAYCLGIADKALEVQARWRLPPRLSRYAVRVMMGILVRSFDRLAFSTPGSMEMYEQVVGPAVIRRRSRLFVATPSACECLEEGFGARDPRRLLFVGAFIERKGVRQMLAAWDVVRERCPGATFHIIGMGALADDVIAWAKERAEVTVDIDPPRADIHRALSSSGVLILLSQRQGHWREQIGQPLQEALGHGCEIVTTSETGLAAWLEDHDHEVVAPDASPEEVASRVADAFDRAAHRHGSLDDLPTEHPRATADRWMVTGTVD